MNFKEWTYLDQTFGQHFAVKLLENVLVLNVLEHGHNLNNNNNNEL